MLRTVCLLMVLATLACGTRPTPTSPTPDPEELPPTPTQEDTPVNYLFWQERFMNGTDLAARGNEPFWSLDFDWDTGWQYSTPEREAPLRFPVGEMEWQEDGSLRVRSSAGKQRLEATISPVACADDMSGEPFTHRISAQIDRQTVEGCARWLFDTRLHDIWVLDQLGGRPASTLFTTEVPSLEAQPAVGKIMGHAGCNTYRGTIIMQGDRLSIQRPVTTKRACPDLKGEDEFIRALVAAHHYRIADLRLRLYTADGAELASFRKVD